MNRKIYLDKLTTGTLIILNNGDKCIVQKDVFFSGKYHKNLIESQEEIIGASYDCVIYENRSVMPMYLFEDIEYAQINKILVPNNTHSMFSFNERDYTLIYEKNIRNVVVVNFGTKKPYLFSVPDSHVENICSQLKNKPDKTKVVVETNQGLQIATVDSFYNADKLTMNELINKYHATLPLKKVVGVLK